MVLSLLKVMAGYKIFLRVQHFTTVLYATNQSCNICYLGLTSKRCRSLVPGAGRTSVSASESSFSSFSCRACSGLLNRVRLSSDSLVRVTKLPGESVLCPVCPVSAGWTGDGVVARPGRPAGLKRWRGEKRLSRLLTTCAVNINTDG